MGINGRAMAIKTTAIIRNGLIGLPTLINQLDIGSGLK
jgi:hypothetical protein